jgi:hypothetical protein
MIEITADTMLRRHPEAAHRIIDGTALIVMPRQAKMLTLNAVGTRVWELLENRTAAEMAKSIAAEFEVTEERAIADTLKFLRQLDERGMLVGV